LSLCFCGPTFGILQLGEGLLGMPTPLLGIVDSAFHGLQLCLSLFSIPELLLGCF
jgi:hypothetical protein